MTRAEALKSYTLDAAYAAFEEDLRGTPDYATWFQPFVAVEKAKVVRAIREFDTAKMDEHCLFVDDE